MVLVVKCLICHKELPYKQSDPSELIEHVRTEHPLASRRSRQSVEKSHERKAKTENDLGSLKRNSASLRSLIDKEVQTDFVWNHFVKMNNHEDSQRLSKDSPRPSKDSQRSSKDTKRHLNVTVIKKKPERNHQRTLSPPRLNDEYKTESADNPPPPKPPRTFTHRKPDGDYSPQTLPESVCPIQEVFGYQKDSENCDKIRMKAVKDSKILHSSKRYVKDAKTPPNCKQETQNNERQHRKFYKTSIEKWRPIGDEKINCPRCQSLKRPIVRTQAEHVTASSFIATLVMTCWPFCFAPCLFPDPTHESLHCPVCNYHLGVYDHQKKVMLPNQELSRDY